MHVRYVNSRVFTSGYSLREPAGGSIPGCRKALRPHRCRRSAPNSLFRDDFVVAATRVFIPQHVRIFTNASRGPRSLDSQAVGPPSVLGPRTYAQMPSRPHRSIRLRGSCRPCADPSLRDGDGSSGPSSRHRHALSPYHVRQSCGRRCLSLLPSEYGVATSPAPPSKTPASESRPAATNCIGLNTCPNATANCVAGEQGFDMGRPKPCARADGETRWAVPPTVSRGGATRSGHMHDHDIPPRARGRQH